MPQAHEALEQYVRKSTYYEKQDVPPFVKQFWPTQASFDWFVKHHRAKLTKRGGAKKIGRDWYIHAGLFPDACAEIFDISIDTIEGTARSSG